jgi:hypothetical protein
MDKEQEPSSKITRDHIDTFFQHHGLDKNGDPLPGVDFHKVAANRCNCESCALYMQEYYLP